MTTREQAEMVAKFRTPPGMSWTDLANDIETLLIAEREACAKILDDKARSLDEWAEKFRGTFECFNYQVRATDARDSSDAIRNRTKNEE
jgi:hypothetical protein